MNKLNFFFYFSDEPQFCTTATRADVANRLRAYRRQPGKFRVYATARRSGAHQYTIEAHGAVAIISQTAPALIV